MKLIITILGLILSHTALSESISEQDIKFFVEESSLGYGAEISKIKNNEELMAKKGLAPNDALYASLKYNTRD